MKQIRCGVFETNSSSTHSLSICSEEEFNKWTAGELIRDAEDEVFIETSSLKKDKLEDGYYQTFEEFEELFGGDDGLMIKKYTTKSGEGVVAFGGEQYN